MYKPDDHDIDRISREAAERYKAPGIPSWDTLQQTLDKELPQEKEKKRRGLFFFFLLAGLLLTGSVVWYGIHTSHNTTANSIATKKSLLKDHTIESENNTSATKEKDNTKQVALNVPAVNSIETPKPGSATKNSIPAGSASSPSAIKPTNNNDKVSVVSAKGTEKAASINHTVKNNLTNKKISAAALASTIASTSNTTKNNTGHHAAATRISKASKGNRLQTARKQNDQLPGIYAQKTTATNQVKINKFSNGRSANKMTASKNAGNVLADDITVSGNHQKDAGDNADGKTTNAGTNNGNNEPPLTPASADTAYNKPTVVKNIDADKPAAASKDSVQATAVKPKTKSKNNKAILLGLTAGIDQSTVKFTYGSSLGYNIGFMGGYQFSSHWSVYTGVVYTKKNYKLNGSDFHPPKHYWTTYVNLETVEGYCRMWEVPVLARYTFNPGARMPFFMSAGLSSYIMKKQGYDYYYKTNTGMPASGTWNEDSTFNHIFSILSLSAGFQKNVGKYMNWQIEPYAKIPLGGVGFGDIKLSSFGINLTVQYKRPVKR